MSYVHHFATANVLTVSRVFKITNSAGAGSQTRASIKNAEIDVLKKLNRRYKERVTEHAIAMGGFWNDPSGMVIT